MDRSLLNRIEEKSEKSQFFVVLFVLFCLFFQCYFISSRGQNAKLIKLITNVCDDILTN